MESSSDSALVGVSPGGVLWGVPQGDAGIGEIGKKVVKSAFFACFVGFWQDSKAIPH